MSKELENLYANKNIDLKNMVKRQEDENSIKYVINKKNIVSHNSDGSSNYEIKNIIDSVSVTGVEQQAIENSLLNKTLFNTKKEALAYIEYIEKLDRVVSAAIKVNIADNNGDGFFADYANEDERKYIVAYNERTASLSYDFTYTILAAMTDYRLCFRNQTIAENFIRAFHDDLIFINQYRVQNLKNRL